MKTLILFAGSALLAAAPALAQSGAAASAPPAAGGGTTQSSTTAAPASVTVGAKVSDTKGGQVGTISAVNGNLATLDTGTNKVALPTSSFANGTDGLLIAMTKAEVDAAANGAAEKAKADLAASLKPGTQVSDTKGGVAGTIEAADAQFVTVATANSKVKLPVTAFAAGANGPVIAMTAAELDAAAKGAAPGGGR
ncbi:hypothetical protein [Sphingomonas jatrophae]|uniref:PRC-barrel domain-containing protein n=1 Tax=Sphingomonas jatrophae TaxID=1166337 RepID=A0A1I6JI07_9SPHN|nr:hypothetical protein [Sphingomonas jatrophae]SFR78585.1 hypothetical protein SAMN05192580_0297 [Sphingomonas jatrophae]